MKKGGKNQVRTRYQDLGYFFRMQTYECYEQLLGNWLTLLYMQKFGNFCNDVASFIEVTKGTSY